MSHSCQQVFMEIGMCLPLEFICYQLQQMMFLLLINVKSCINSNQSSVTVPSVWPVCLTTSVHDNVIKKPITCRDSIIKCGRKCLCKSTIVKNGNAVNYFSESINNVGNYSRSFSTSSSGFVCQPFRLINLFINI